MQLVTSLIYSTCASQYSLQVCEQQICIKIQKLLCMFQVIGVQQVRSPAQTACVLLYSVGSHGSCTVVKYACE